MTQAVKDGVIPQATLETKTNAVSLGEAIWTWAKIGLLSFGGPAGQIAVMHRILVDEKKWISDERFLHALNFCMLLPGPEAQQLATYIGWILHRVRGGLVAGTGHVSGAKSRGDCNCFTSRGADRPAFT